MRIDPHSETWRAVKAWAEERLVVHRRRLETPGLPPVETEQLRGAIREIQVLLKQPEPGKLQPIESAASADSIGV